MKKTALILIASFVCVCMGVAVAYYNTASLGYDNAVLFFYDENEIRVMDYEIKYRDIEEFAEKVSDNLITI